MLYIQFLFLLLMLYTGSRFGGIGLGVISGIGLAIEVFIFGLSSSRVWSLRSPSSVLPG